MLNFDLAKHPFNWFLVLLVLAAFFTVAHVIFSNRSE